MALIGGGSSEPLVLDGGSSTTYSDSDDSTETTTTTFDPDEQTLGTTSLGTTQGDDEPDTIEVEESTADPSDSSPAGGAGAEEAVERFAGLQDETLDDASTEEILEVGNAASDYYTAENRDNEEEAQEANQEMNDAVENANNEPNNEPADGGSNDSEGIGRAGKAGAALLVGALLVGDS